MRLAILLLVTISAFSAELTEFQATTTFGYKAPTLRSAAAEQNKVAVFPGDDVLPQVANGDGWKTQITLINLSPVSLPFILDFWGSDGSFWSLAISGLGTGDRITGTLAPGASRVFETTGQGPLAQGWAELTYDHTAGRIGGFGVFRQSVAGRPDFEAVVPLCSLFDEVVVLPYDNTGGFVTGIAAVNGSRTSPATFTATFRDANGVTYATETISLPRSGHLAFTMPQRFPVTQGKRGSVLLRSSTYFLSVVGLRFNPGGAFTTFSGLNTLEMLEQNPGPGTTLGRPPGSF